MRQSNPYWNISLFLTFLAWIGSAVRAQNPATQPSAINPSLPTLWIVGDSTANNTANGALGWGTPFTKLFDSSKINVVNRARGGRSSRSYQVEGLWDQVLASVKTGDFILLQMGHNDGGDISSPNGRPSLPGVGEESQEITKANGTKETVHTYGWYMRKYVTDAKAKGATIIICSSVPHLPRAEVKEGDVETRFAQVGWAEEVAKSEKVPFIHVNKIILSHYVGMPPADIRAKYFTPPGDGTHTNPVGADLNARSVVEGIKQLENSPLKAFILDK